MQFHLLKPVNPVDLQGQGGDTSDILHVKVAQSHM